MMSHRKKNTDLFVFWAILQILLWSVMVIAILFVVTGCKSAEQEPGKRPRPGPTFVREPLHSMCGRCFERPELGHASEE